MNNPISGSMAGKVCLVTGSTAGIGKVTAAVLAAQGAELIISGRNQDKAMQTVQEIKDATGNEKVSYLLADLSALDQVREMARSFLEIHSRLDLLVNNAGAFFNSRINTRFGVEKTLLVNHLGPFLLTNLLLELIKESTPARIVNVSSEGHRQGNLNFEDLGFDKGYFGMKAYGRSKLANILFTYELAQRLEGTGVTVNALHPGHIATDMWKTSFPVIGPALKWFMSRIALSPEEGAQNTIYLATSPDVAEITGKYFIEYKPAQSSAISYDRDISARLWDISKELVRL
jgi:retinol dehydrogenase-12